MSRAEDAINSKSRNGMMLVLSKQDARQKVLLDIYDNHFYAQSPFTALYREASMFKEYDWEPPK